MGRQKNSIFLRLSFYIALSIIVASKFSVGSNTTLEKPPGKSDDATGGNWFRNCTPPGIAQFPRPLIPPEVRKQGGIIIHILLCIYLFYAIAITCDDFFVPSLESISDALALPSDVAGATFMAAGSSAPELASSVIGVFVAQDDIGISGIIGSAVFNVMLVVSVCSLFAGTVVYLRWYPLVRDSLYYLLSIGLLLLVIQDEKVYWYEALVLLIFYVLYCVLMYLNKPLEVWVESLNLPCSKKCDVERTSLFKPLQEKKSPSVDGSIADGVAPSTGFHLHESVEEEIQHTLSEAFHVPDGCMNKFKWAARLPLILILTYTIPNCRVERWKRWYPVSFFMSIVWLSFFSYILIWMLTIIGYTMSIPDTVMGLTFLAAGASLPDALSSLMVVREGYGDMAVANAIGSNVFDILLCLGFPWFVKTAIVSPGTAVIISSKGLVYSTVSLFSTVAFLLIATHLNNWRLTKKYGVALLLWYLVFMVIASLYELNVFGYMNPPECPSNF